LPKAKGRRHKGQGKAIGKLVAFFNLINSQIGLKSLFIERLHCHDLKVVVIETAIIAGL